MSLHRVDFCLLSKNLKQMLKTVFRQRTLKLSMCYNRIILQSASSKFI